MTPQEIYAKLKERFGEAIGDLDETVLQPAIAVDASKIDLVGQYLRDSDALAFDYLMNLSAVDLDENVGVVYHLLSMRHRHKIVLKVQVSKEKPDVNSVAMLWRTADWHEREAYDMIGVNFVNHPDLRRILLPEDWQGYPLRKDYVTPEYYQGIKVPHPDAEEKE